MKTNMLSQLYSRKRKSLSLSLVEKGPRRKSLHLVIRMMMNQRKMVRRQGIEVASRRTFVAAKPSSESEMWDHLHFVSLPPLCQEILSLLLSLIPLHLVYARTISFSSYMFNGF